MVAGITNLGKINGYSIEVIENPGYLNDPEKEILVRDLNAISIDAFNKPTPMEETRERTVCVDLVFLIRQEEIVGYTTNDILLLEGYEVNYFSSALFKRKIQQQGLYGRINDLRLEFRHSERIMTRTQNPLVAQGFKNLCDRHRLYFYPSNEAPVPDLIKRIAQAYAPTADEHLICKGVYGRALMDTTPKPNEGTKYFFQSLDIECGDAIILLGSRLKI